jgi:NAD(P)-dependent dehydrogenase (short-subunit alcohol dehydrogenase family)
MQQASKIIVVTGASSGVGFSAARELARQGAEIVMVSRNPSRAEDARARVAEGATGPRPELFLADLSSQAEIRRLAAAVRERYERVDVLINNAGGVFDRREVTAEGIERTFATNHLAPFFLTNLILDLIKAAPHGRIVTIASESYSRTLDFSNLQGEYRYSFLGAYRLSKLANLIFSHELARRLEDTRVTANAVSPGPTRTRFGDHMRGRAAVFPLVMKRLPFFADPETGARALVHAASAPELEGVSGRFFLRTREKATRPLTRDPGVARRLWRLSEELCGIAPGDVKPVAA